MKLQASVFGVLVGALLSPSLVQAQTYSKTETIEYHDDLSLWVLGQVKRTTTNGSETSRTDYGWKALPWKTYSFGKLQETLSYDSTSTVASGQLGTLKTITDGNNNVTTATAWKRGIPQSIKYPGTPESPTGATQSATVSDAGWITSVTDENGYKTCYGYDAMGRINLITYPSETQLGVCDTSAWAPTTITFAATGNAAAYGMPAGHWRQTTLTGNGRKILIFDALWRPVVEQTLDLGNVSGTLSEVIKRYDPEGRLAFQSYPMNTGGQANYADTNLKGTKTTYDALGRVTSVSQDSELGPLTTTTRYLAGFKTEVTNPRLQKTTTSYMAYDQPTYDWPTAIVHPEGAFTDISRDAFGKPKAIGRRNANTTTALSRHYVYDGYQRLCKVVEPETKATVLDYDNADNLLGSAAGLNLLSLSSCNTGEAAASGRRVQRSYDARNRVATLAFPDGNGNQRWTYWPDGQVKQVTTTNAGVATHNSYAYNRRRLLAGESLSPADGEAWAMSYGYTRNGHLASTRYPSGQTVAYAPNALGQATRAGTYATGVSYYPNGAIKQFTYGNGIVHTLAQNARQLPDTSRDAYGSTAFLSDSYDYDHNGNVAAISDGATGRNQRGNRTLTYDGLDRLTQAVSPMFGTASYGYDVLDNLTRVVAPGRDHHYCYDGNWQLTNIKAGGCTGSTVIGLGYDVQGNLNNKNGQGFVFDYGNRLRTATGKESYRYDGHGRRTHAAHSTGTIRSMYDQGGVLRHQKNARQNTTTDYIQLGGSLVAEAEWPLGQLPSTLDYVNWSSVSGAVRYVVEESVDGVTWASVYEGSDLAWTSLARPSGTYTYRVLACNAAGVCTAVSSVTHAQRPAFNIVPLLYQIILS
ncbi:RHS repeat domain-containing protein [Pseudoxanthomonas wuyuanensis]|uniref:RHS Repeat n=1 Tax=Pseudoxanthomonas wuyuanensis TaxID=1073196 RepID=A0A286DBP5_9GAMM|nr:RHS repeat protein [Pseudoxanthomonas wuyuanensis]KAF1721721.1 RHS repeat protein [Pseudoxanthomonas wuyuanensis]SOD56038.1 RHS Repeat [Pseudoxanthomonas wuyuanensis]